LESTEAQWEELRIRSIELRDAEAVAELIGQLGYQRTSESVREWIAGLERCAKTQAAFVACVGNEIAGWIEASIERRLQSPAFALIGGLVVKDGSRNRGIGARLCTQVERWARERGVGKVRVTSRSSREGAHRFYLREGYRQTKTSMVFEKEL
jgi:GNAT superfamily N-acetyltransferase